MAWDTLSKYFRISSLRKNANRREKVCARCNAAIRPLPNRHAYVSAISHRSKIGSQTFMIAWCKTRSRKHGAVISRCLGSKIVN